jgi:hypothetical protein
MSRKHIPYFEIYHVKHENQVSPAVLASGEKTGEDNWLLLISEARKLHYEAGWAIHELAEVLALILHKKNIDFKEIAKFYEAHADVLDPGSLPNSPNHEEHVLALKVERAFVEGLKIPWSEYYNDKNPLDGKKGRTAHEANH